MAHVKRICTADFIYCCREKSGYHSHCTLLQYVSKLFHQCKYIGRFIMRRRLAGKKLQDHVYLAIVVFSSLLTVIKSYQLKLMKGDLFVYANRGACSLVAFEETPVRFGGVLSDSTEQETKLLSIVIIGGLYDGMMSIPWCPALSQALIKEQSPDRVVQCCFDVSIVHPELGSSRRQWGTSSLLQDVEDISDLINYLQLQRSREIILIGHSTGCQISLHTMRFGRCAREYIRAIILQSPIPDRLYLQGELGEAKFSALEEWAAQQCRSEDASSERLRGEQTLAAQMMDGNVPITAYRLNSLMRISGDDDYFSLECEDQSDRFRCLHEFESTLKVVAVQWSGREEFLGELSADPTALMQWYDSAFARMRSVSPPSLQLWPVLPEADHGISTPFSEQQEFASRVMQLIKQMGPS